MADPSATISIYAQLPKDLIPNTDLDPTNWVWAQCLAFPVNKLNSLRFSSKPYKWIRYATGIAIRVPSNDTERSEWPPPSLFEALYASAVIHHFGAIPVDLFKKWEVVFDEPDGASKTGQTDAKRRHDQADVEKGNRENQKPKRERRYYRGRRRDGGFDAFDMLTMIPFMAMPAEKARDYLEGREKMAAAKEREGLEVKVNSWRETVPSTSNK